MEKCANCERKIGNLETGHVFDGKVVCEECGERLKAKAVAAMPVETVAFDYTRKAPTRVGPPDYEMLLLCGNIVMGMGVLSIVAGFALLAFSIERAELIVPGVSMLLYGVFTMAFGEAAKCLRDIARSTFRPIGNGASVKKDDMAEWVIDPRIRLILGVGIIVLLACYAAFVYLRPK